MQLMLAVVVHGPDTYCPGLQAEQAEQESALAVDEKLTPAVQETHTGLGLAVLQTVAIKVPAAHVGHGRQMGSLNH